LSQAQLAELSGVSLRHLAGVETGANISVGMLLKLAVKLDMRELKLGALSLHFARIDRDRSRKE
jgi:transcriptional regulator with XRE-family HTH domain